jgi:hypothetical protein
MPLDNRKALLRFGFGAFPQNPNWFKKSDGGRVWQKMRRLKLADSYFSNRNGFFKVDAHCFEVQ